MSEAGGHLRGCVPSSGSPTSAWSRDQCPSVKCSPAANSGDRDGKYFRNYSDLTLSWPPPKVYSCWGHLFLLFHKSIGPPQRGGNRQLDPHQGSLRNTGPEPEWGKGDTKWRQRRETRQPVRTCAQSLVWRPLPAHDENRFLGFQREVMVSPGWARLPSAVWTWSQPALCCELGLSQEPSQ